MEDGVIPGRLSGQVCKKLNRETASPWEGWEVVLTVAGWGDEGGGDCADSDINPLEAEHGRAIYCDAANYGPVRGGSKTARGTVPKEMVGAEGGRLEGG